MTVGEGGIRVPLLIAGPGIPSGEQNDEFIYVWDIMPTLLDIAGVDYPKKFNGIEVESMRGRSIRRILDGNQGQAYGPDEIVGGEMGGGKWMRQGALKAVSVAEPYGTGEWQLFDVVNDPGETTDLSEKMPDTMEMLVSAWEQYAEEVGVVD